MKIIYTIDSLQIGGAEKSTLDIASRLSPAIEVIIVTFYPGEQLLHNYNLPTNIRIIQANLPGKYNFKKGVSFFENICRKEQPDIVIAMLFRSEFISRIVCRKLKVKNIGTFVNDTYSRYELDKLSFTQKSKMRLLWILNWWTAKYCYRFLSNGESIKISNAKALHIKEQKIDVIPRGRDISLFNITDRGELDNGPIKFISVGRLLKRKGQAELIKGFSLFLQQFPNATLSIAGEGAYRTELERIIVEEKIADKVHLLGTVKDIPHLLSQYHFFVFPSHYEGFSGALVEAMLAGIPVLASDIDMNKEAVLHLETGYLFKVMNPESLCNSMLYAVNNIATMNAYAVKARQVAEKKFDIGQIAKLHQEYYEHIVSQA